MAFSSLVALLDLILLRLILIPRKSPRINRWIQDGVFQLQRRAYEVHGEGTWYQIEKEIPMTIIGEQLGDLPLTLQPVCACRGAKSVQHEDELKDGN